MTHHELPLFPRLPDLLFAASAPFFVGALVIWLVTVLVDRRLVLLHLHSCVWASFYLWTLPGVHISIVE